MAVFLTMPFRFKLEDAKNNLFNDDCTTPTDPLEPVGPHGVVTLPSYSGKEIYKQW
jgi:hypothetical protein